MNEFEMKAGGETGAGLRCMGIKVLQVNVGFRCNQQCAHCHVEASPSRGEMMEWETMERIIDAFRGAELEAVDITGGAPEMNGYLEPFIAAFRIFGHKVQVRTNLTALLEPGREGLPHFFKEYDVGLVASLPCYLEENVAAQRGSGVYEKSIEALRRLNALGFGTEGGLQLDLVYNPAGAFLPPPQEELEADYRRELGTRFGVEFTRLRTITNMPIGRFGQTLERRSELAEYMELLKGAFNPATVEGLMCRHQIEIGWDGTLYDCDFNLALGLAVDHGAPSHICLFDRGAVAGRGIVTGEHCFGCTAGAGSSCAGSIAKHRAQGAGIEEVRK